MMGDPAETLLADLSPHNTMVGDNTAYNYGRRDTDMPDIASLNVRNHNIEQQTASLMRQLNQLSVMLRHRPVVQQHAPQPSAYNDGHEDTDLPGLSGNFDQWPLDVANGESPSQDVLNHNSN